MPPYYNNGSELKPNWIYTYKPFYFDIVINFNNTLLTIDSIIWKAICYIQENGYDTPEFTKSITHIMVYTDKQCSGLIPFNTTPNSWFDNNLPSYINGTFRFNNFRDMVIVENSPILDDDGLLFDENYNGNISGVAPLTIGNKNTKNWFEKSFIISKFAAIRFYVDSQLLPYHNRIIKISDVSLEGKINNR